MTEVGNGGTTAFDSARMAARLMELEQLVVDETIKGLPPLGIPLAQIPGERLSLLNGDLPLPVAVLRDSAIQRNRAWMNAFLSASGIRIAPHGKTPMAPRIAEMQMQDGAWGITAATVQQAMIFAGMGIQRIIIANQVMGACNIRLALDLIRQGIELYVLIDSFDGAETLAEAHRTSGARVPVHVLVEVGAHGGRTGVRGLEPALDLARRVASLAPHLILRGVETYEGIFGDAPFPQRQDFARAMTTGVLAVARACAKAGLFASGPVLLTAGGTEFFDLAASDLTAGIAGHEVIPVIRSGCYITHDHLSFDRMFRRLLERRPDLSAIGPGLTPALEVWAAVQSIPEPGLAFATMGKRDVSYDIEMPVPVLWFRSALHTRPIPIPPGHTVSQLNDQHAFLKVPYDTPLRVGDLIGFGVSHVCTTFDKWRVVLKVDDEYRVTGAIRTLF
jgi:D-serine dehydratase